MASSQEKSSDIIERRAVNPSGHLGDLYDGCRDRIIEQSKTGLSGKCSQSSKKQKCYLTCDKIGEITNLLQCIRIQDELQLSLSLNLVKRDGIAQVLNYPGCIDQYTGILYYFWIAREHQLQKIPEIEKMKGIRNPCVNATHMITSIAVGIDLVAVLQLPPNTNTANKIDSTLENIRNILLGDEDTKLNSSRKGNKILEDTLYVTVYSNIPSLTGTIKVSDLRQEVNSFKTNATLCRPVFYTLQTIISLYPASSIKAATFRPLPRDLLTVLGQQMLQFRDPIKHSETYLNANASKPRCRHFQHLEKARTQFEQVKTKFIKEIQRFSKLVVDTRCGRINPCEINQALHADEQITLKSNIDELIRLLSNLRIDGRSTTLLQRPQLGYRNAAKPNSDKSKDRRSNEPILTNSVRSDRDYCSMNALTKNKPEHVQKPYFNLANESESSSHPSLINSDIRSNDYELPNIMAASPRKTNNDYNQSASLPSTYTDVTAASLPSPPLATDDVINILLLGETGVGKSTFINAFANYLTFDSLEQAQNNEPIVIIPVSFIIATGENFDERLIKFGEVDSANNENFNKVGQSVTQHCKAYVFDLHHTNGRKLRIIDTPGFGDTRGIEQDDINMEHILQYINNLTHLNAICFLLKPNSSRLNMFFRSCLTQLFSFLNADARKNVIFCFTSARSTFYTPGDTAPLLKTMLNSLSFDAIPFEKKNTFCFDSESFRYLVAIQNDVSFTDEDKREYGMSWSTSVKESNRLINYIDTKLILYDMKSGWQSIKHAQFEIAHMVRPMLEAMRNILRNIILCKNNLPNEFIKLRSKPLHRTATRCRNCKSPPHQVGQIWVIPTVTHEIHDGCIQCSCALNQHVPVDYMLKYKLLNNSSKLDQKKMIADINELCQACVEFAHFLIHVAGSTKDDPFFIGLVEIVFEENSICESQKLTHLNIQLVQELTKIQHFHEQQTNKKKLNRENVELSVIYKLIKTIGEYPVVQEQMAAVKKTQQIMMKEYENEVPTF